MNNIDIQEIIRILPHRYPFLLIDRVIDFEPGVSLKAIKNVTINEPYFLGHFPKKPIMPGVLLIETIAQATGILGAKTNPDKVKAGSLYYLVGIDKARFKKQVIPGDQLEIDIQFLASRRNIWKFSGTVKVEGKLAASAEMLCTPRDE